MLNNENRSNPRLPVPDIDRFERRAHAIIATMSEVGEMPEADRRENDRQRFLTQARLRPTQMKTEDGQPVTLYTRDLTDHGVGFIATGELPADGRAVIDLPGPAGRSIAAEGQIIRAQTFASGWHEGYVRFDGPIDLFSDEPTR